MKILVTTASRHGATAQIGEAIGEELRADGMTVDVLAVERVESLEGYDAVVVGSAVYLGRWLATARDFVNAHAEELRRVPVWLFGSGPITPVEGEMDTADGKELKGLIEARDHRMFPGQLKKEGLSLVERVSVRMVGSPWGDYRPWPEIRAWADSIAGSLARA